MGVWSRSPLVDASSRAPSGMMREYHRVLPGWTPDDVVGSPYCIDGYDPDARMGGWAGLAAAREELSGRGIGLILDFIPNHTGFDHRWVRQHPQRYVLGTDEDARSAPDDFRTRGQRAGDGARRLWQGPDLPPWRDVAQLNYFNPETREAMRRQLGKLAAYCDGVRCDMAMLALNDVFERTWRARLHGDWPRLPDEFWPAATRSTPELTYIAEVYWDLEGVLLDQGFTFADHKRLLDALHASDAAPRVRQLLVADRPPATGLVRFLENHDEARSAVMFADRVPAAAALAGTIPGMRFVFDGQQDGRRIRSPVQLARWPDEPVDVRVRAIRTTRCCSLPRSDSSTMEPGKRSRPQPPATTPVATFFGTCWRSVAGLAIVAVNLSTSPAHANIPIRADLLHEGDTFRFDDALTGERYRWTRDALERIGLYVRLDPGAAHLFSVSATT